MLVQHTGEVPETLPVTDETRERLREQANQLGAPTVVRLIDLLHVAVEDMRQGGDPRLPLELGAREGDAARLGPLARGARLPARPARAGRRRLRPAARRAAGAAARAVACAERPTAHEPSRTRRVAAPPLEPPSLELEQLQEAWRRTVVPAVEQRSIPTAAILTEAHPAALAGDTLTLEFAPAAKFHLSKAEEPKNVAAPARRALRGDRPQARRSCSRSARNGNRRADEDERPATEEEIVELMKRTFDARGARAR